MMTRFPAGFQVFLALILFSGGYWFGQSRFAPLRFGDARATTPAEARAQFAPFWDVWTLVHREYFDQPLDDERLVTGAIDGMLSALDDPYAAYRPFEEQVAFEARFSGEFEGIGAEVTLVDEQIVVVAPIEGSPAEAAGLLPGDILLAADGVELTGMDLTAGAGLVRGPAGTTVHLLVERDGQTLTFNITRGVVRNSAVRFQMLPDEIAYLRLSRFGDTDTVRDFEDALDTLLAQNPRGLIFDVRQNPGGLLTTAIDVADHFLPEGPILFEAFGDGRERQFSATDDGLAENIPIVVLMDEGSASASELLAGALRDRGRATLIGQSTFGKGTVQSSWTVSDGGGVSFTVARWLTPNRHWIQDDGVAPDYYVPGPQPGARGTDEDPQIQAAIDFLLGRPVESVLPEVTTEDS